MAEEASLPPDFYCKPGSLSYVREYIRAINTPLTGEAAGWAENNPTVQHKISKTELTIEELKRLLKERFSQQIKEPYTSDFNSVTQS